MPQKKSKQSIFSRQIPYNLKNEAILDSTAGFTLIELLVVISIITFLASMVIASVNSARIRGRDTRRLEDVKTLSEAITLYMGDKGSPPTTTPPYIDMDDDGSFLPVLKNLGYIDRAITGPVPNLYGWSYYYEYYPPCTPIGPGNPGNCNVLQNQTILDLGAFCGYTAAIHWNTKARAVLVFGLESGPSAKYSQYFQYNNVCFY